MTYKVTYKDEAGYTWTSTFETGTEALDQAAVEANIYGGTTPQDVKDSSGTVVNDQAAIEQAAEAILDTGA